jgi:hypothetical protein
MPPNQSFLLHEAVAIEQGLHRAKTARSARLLKQSGESGIVREAVVLPPEGSILGQETASIIPALGRE